MKGGDCGVLSVQGQAVDRGDVVALFKFLLTLQEKFTKVNKKSEFIGGIWI